MPDTRRLRPILRVGQYTSQSREFRIVDPDGDPVDVSDADVTLSMEHDKLAYTAIDGGDVTIVDGVGGYVEYSFSAEETSLHGRYRVQFEVEYSDGETALYPPDDHTWVLDVGRRIPESQPLTVPSVSAREGTYESLQVEALTVDEASISVLDGDPDISELSIEDLDVDTLTGGIVGTRGPVVRLDGPNLQITNGELGWSDPNTGDYTEGSDHDHSETGSGGDTLRPTTVGTTDSRVETLYSDHVDVTALDVPGWELVDVTNHGADPTGTDDLVPVLDSLAADGRLLILPSGTYYMGETFSYEGFEQFGIVGRGDVTILTDADFDTEPGENLFLLGAPGDTDLRFGGFRIDFTAADTGYRVLDAKVDDGLLVEDVRVKGTNDTATSGCISVSIETVGGTGTVRRWRAPDGGTPADTDQDSPYGMYVRTDSDGQLWIEDCHFEGWVDEGLYANGPGPVHVRGGRWANNGGSQLRFHGAGSSARDVDVSLDDPEKTDGEFGEPRLIWVRAPNVTLDNISATVDGQPTLGVAFTNDSKGSVLRDSSITLTCPTGEAIEVIDNNHDATSDARPVIQGVDIDAAYSEAERQCLNIFSPVVLRDVTVNATDAGGGVHAVEVRDTGHVTVRGGTFVSDGRALEFSSADSARDYSRIQSVNRAESRDGVTDIRLQASAAAWITDCVTVNGVEATGDYAGGASDYQRGNHTI